ncbi:hypothetical protein QBC47DRAFT_167336 [Echria macrotheca]|uniref:Secreted protein n=1 Tax=Echria macrotheca TaxID=438768 RepID=A0AAJ0BJC2_9PEZI|nr:hypothetical protein QBC47DRAFT_167336 [Echria macrotheca]
MQIPLLIGRIKWLIFHIISLFGRFGSSPSSAEVERATSLRGSPSRGSPGVVRGKTTIAAESAVSPDNASRKGFDRCRRVCRADRTVSRTAARTTLWQRVSRARTGMSPAPL